MRLDLLCFSVEYDLGAITDNKIVEKVGHRMANHPTFGRSYNFAPVVDINTNPKNPILATVLWRRQRKRNERHLLF